jgi:glycosyltransferase involved in cell wall biosynthesis
MMMKICLVGKYPPIEGGVSASTYWLARGLAERGHDIHVVTNADEVEDRFRLLLGSEDAEWYQPRFESGGRVRLYNAEPFSRYAMGHIPLSNPFVSKLASLATDIVRRHDCDTILAYYFEPYAVAGWLASRWTGCPLIIKHAGSDLDRLFRVPDLATTYKEVLRSADAVVTQPSLMVRFLGMGVDRERLARDIPYSLPREIFNSGGDTLDIVRAAISPSEAQDAAQPVAGHRQIPTIGVYGKVGITKGTLDLIASLGQLSRQGLAFRFAAMIGKGQGQTILSALQDAGIEGQTCILPMLPNWRVASFLRACTTVCFLERDFPVAIHGPIVPREVLACGTCLVLSEEIASKQRYRDRLIPGENVLIVKDPKDHTELANTVRLVLADPERARAIGVQGTLLSRSIEGEDTYVPGWEKLLARHVRRVTPRSPTQTPAPETQASFEWVIPDLARFLRGACSQIFTEFPGGSSDGHPFALAIRFCDFAAKRIESEAFGADLPKVVAALFYAKERLIVSYDPIGNTAPTFPIVDRLAGRTVSRESAWHLRPVRGSSVRMVPFEYDVSALSILASVGGHEPTGDNGGELADIVRRPILVLFHRSANLIPCELRIDDATRELVNCCDGSVSTQQLIDTMCCHFNVGTPELRDHVVVAVCGALDRLYRSGVLVFGEHRDGWGWLGGYRTGTA